MAYVKRDGRGEIVTVFHSAQAEELEFLAGDADELKPAEPKAPRKLPLQVIAAALLELHEDRTLSDETIAALRLLEG